MPSAASISRRSSCASADRPGAQRARRRHGISSWRAIRLRKSCERPVAKIHVQRGAGARRNRFAAQYVAGSADAPRVPGAGADHSRRDDGCVRAVVGEFEVRRDADHADFRRRPGQDAGGSMQLRSVDARYRQAFRRRRHDRRQRLAGGAAQRKRPRSLRDHARPARQEAWPAAV